MNIMVRGAHSSVNIMVNGALFLDHHWGGIVPAAYRLFTDKWGSPRPKIFTYCNRHIKVQLLGVKCNRKSYLQMNQFLIKPFSSDNS